MPRQFRDFYKSLCGDVPKLSEPKAQLIINDALEQIYDSYLWHFLIEQSYISVPDQVNTGTLSLIQGSASVTPDATAKALLDSIGLSPPITERQLRIGSQQLYEIAGYDSAALSDNLTLTQPYLGETDSASSYTIYRGYFSPPLYSGVGDPTLDFVRFKLIHNRVPGYFPLVKKTQADLNQWDPQRNYKSDPYWYAPFRTRSRKLVDGVWVADDTPLFEFHPHPVAARTLFCLYQRRGTLLTADTDALPSPLTQQLVLSLSRYLAYEWADSNKGMYPVDLGTVNWARKRSELMDPNNRGSYPHQLGLAIKLDREMFLSSYLGNYYKDLYSQGFPGGSWPQNHGVSLGYSAI